MDKSSQIHGISQQSPRIRSWGQIREFCKSCDGREKCTAVTVWNIIQKVVTFSLFHSSYALLIDTMNKALSVWCEHVNIMLINLFVKL